VFFPDCPNFKFSYSKRTAIQICKQIFALIIIENLRFFRYTCIIFVERFRKGWQIITSKRWSELAWAYNCFVKDFPICFTWNIKQNHLIISFHFINRIPWLLSISANTISILNLKKGNSGASIITIVMKVFVIPSMKRSPIEKFQFHFAQ
jgi:hypothetical protein